jgi:hypothetical protein
MRVLIDEDTPVQVVEPLKHLLRGHQIDHVSAKGWKGKKDRFLLRDAKKANYDVIITRDHNQLSDPAECKAIKSSGLHHVLYSQRRQGMIGLALAIGAVIAAMPQVMAELDQADGQRLVRIAGLDPGRRRYTVTDPRKDPPPYWPH